jgi:hypothetical protein
MLVDDSADAESTREDARSDAQPAEMKAILKLAAINILVTLLPPTQMVKKTTRESSLY